MLVALTFGLLARSFGGWYSTTWGWASIGVLFVAACALLLEPEVRFSRIELALLGGLAALTAWTGLSWLWSESPPESVYELERAALYLGGVLALLLVARRASVAATLGCLLVADLAVCGHALGTRLFPDRLLPAPGSIARLGGVFAYPNALGVAAVFGLLLAFGFAVDGRRLAVRAAAGALTVPFVLTLFFTFSRGSWVALGVGCAALVALAPERGRLLNSLVPLGVVAAVAVWLASRAGALTRWSDPAGAAPEGHRLALAAVALAAAAAIAVCALELAGRRRWVLVAVAVAALVLGGLVPPARTTATQAPAAPGAAAATAPADSAAAAPATIASAAPEQTARLFTASTSFRAEYWRVALRDFVHHPFAGSGAGSYIREWFAHRTNPASVVDAHSLYLETLAELGLVGFAVLAFVLAVPFVAAVRLRRRPLIAGAFGAYAAFLAHAGVDWDWELPAVTFAGIFCGALVVAAARDEHGGTPLSPKARGFALVAVLALSAFALVGLVGNRAEARALRAAWRGDWQTTEVEARRARVWAPWSAEAVVLSADAASARGDSVATLSLSRAAVRKSPHDWDLWSRLAQVAQGAERERALAQAARLNPLAVPWLTGRRSSP